MLIQTRKVVLYMEYILDCDYVLETVGEEVILIPKHNGKIDVTKCVYLEGTGGEIWKLFSDGLSIKEIEGMLLKKYIVEEEEIRKDIEELFITLNEAGIVRKNDGK